MPEGRRWSPENPSPTMKSFAVYIKEKGYDDSSDLETTVAATFVYHREWQAGHAGELNAEREAAKVAREAEKAEKAKAKEEAKVKKDADKAEKEAAKEAAKAEREAKKAEKEGADGDDGSEGEPAKTGRRLRLKGGAEAPPEAEAAETVGASSASF